MVRLRKSETPTEVWQAHRKLRKKVASAKWYAKKKKREIREQNELRQKLEAEYQATRPTYLWTPRERAYWAAALHHHVRGYPVRPDDVEPETWCGWVDEVERRLQATQAALRGVSWARHVPWSSSPAFVRILRQLGLREVRASGITEDASSTHWRTGPLGVLLAGCVWRWGVSLTLAYWQPLQNAIRHTSIVQSIQRHPPSTWATNQPTTTPHQNHTTTHHPLSPSPGSIDTETTAYWERWIEHTLFPEEEPLSVNMSASDSASSRSSSTTSASSYRSADEQEPAAPRTVTTVVTSSSPIDIPPAQSWVSPSSRGAQYHKRSWYDSEDEEEWLREWEKVDTEKLSPPHHRPRVAAEEPGGDGEDSMLSPPHTPNIPGLITQAPSPARVWHLSPISEEDSLPSSLDPLVDAEFPLENDLVPQSTSTPLL